MRSRFDRSPPKSARSSNRLPAPRAGVSPHRLEKLPLSSSAIENCPAVHHDGAASLGTRMYAPIRDRVRVRASGRQGAQGAFLRSHTSARIGCTFSGVRPCQERCTWIASALSEFSADGHLPPCAGSFKRGANGRFLILLMLEGQRRSLRAESNPCRLVQVGICSLITQTLARKWFWSDP